MLRVTPDTNILISGLNFLGSKPFQFLELARTGRIDLVVSEPILAEMESVLVRKFGFSPEEVAEARMRIEAMTETVKPAVTLDVIKEDPADDRILECAVASESDYLVTGDKHLLNLGKFGPIPIVKVADFLDLFERQQGHNR